MSVDVFGRQLGKSKTRIGLHARGPPGDGFKLTRDGQYDMTFKRLCNVADAIEPDDAVSKKVMEANLQELLHIVHTNLQIVNKHIDDQNTRIESLTHEISVISDAFSGKARVVPFV